MGELPVDYIQRGYYLIAYLKVILYKLKNQPLKQGAVMTDCGCILYICSKPSNITYINSSTNALLPLSLYKP